MEEEKAVEYKVTAKYIVSMPESVNPDEFLDDMAVAVAEWAESVGAYIGGPTKIRIRKVKDG